MSRLTRTDFVSKQEVKWCPGCGDYAILAAMQKALPLMGKAKEEFVFVSGIGCAGRFPYYLSTYGFHTIHGRAPAVASGIKMMNPKLSVWVIIGDGDGLSIGLNHLVHALRRNVNLKILLINNEIYGLTKGQYSPTSKHGQLTRTSPEGYCESALNPVSIALTSGASFVARGFDKDPSHLAMLFKEAETHQGSAFIEIYQNCNVFNDGAFDSFATKTTRQKQSIELKEGEPLVFGETKELALHLSQGQWQLTSPNNGLKHELNNRYHAQLLAEILPGGELPIPVGVFYKENKAIFSDFNKEVKATLNDLEQLFQG